MLALYIFILILLLLIVPFPIKLRVIFQDLDLEVYLYRFKVFSLQKTLKKKKEKEKCKPKKEKKKPKKKKLQFNLEVLKNIIYKLNHNPIKPKMRLCYQMNYSTGDAANTAKIYGIIYQVITTFYMILNIPFKIVENDMNLTPNFQSEGIYVKIKIKSIIFLNLVKIIYMILLILLSLKYKEVDPKGESYGM
ncbi:DUF2953 domain-containing protein [Clostridium sp. YIM B02505]|uniref:DUF2953 domain-containing protein n=1 Tax=Clostridium yunnanense TaxID=2800325 RepID=A0ABS1ENN1_9CLOT|nr:DUF2953 domain-containing protein [Clostridium yunnanense]MBK1810972.1 DUF2953 domain-containing protein [Clostridium yunnanense]